MKKVFSLLIALCLIVGLLPLAALAEEATTPSVYITTKLNNGDADFWADAVAPGAATKYATTTAEGVVADGTADNWNVKLEYPADGKPTLTLKGATLKAGSGRYPLHISGNADLTVVIEADSSISTANRGGFYNICTGVVTITGPGKLTVDSTDGNCLHLAGIPADLNAGTTIIKDANLELNPTGSSTTRAAIAFMGGDVTIDNSKIAIKGTDGAIGIWGYASYTKDANGNVTKVSATWKAGVNDTGKRNLTVQNGSVITCQSTSRQALGAIGTVTIKDSTVEAEITHDFGIFDKKPTFEGNYTAIAGAKKEDAAAYEASKFMSYKYFKITPAADPAPTEPTTPSEPTTTPTQPTTPSGGNNNPQTGDTFNVALAAALALSFVATLAVVTVIGKKKAI